MRNKKMKIKGENKVVTAKARESFKDTGQNQRGF